MGRTAVGTYSIVLSFDKTPSLTYADLPEREDEGAGDRSNLFISHSLFVRDDGLNARNIW